MRNQELKLLVSGLFVLILPLYILCFYVAPSADDFAFSVMTVTKGFWGAQKAWYNDWTGRWVSNFILSLYPPFVEDLLAYRLFSFATLMAFSFAFVSAVRVLAGKIFNPQGSKIKIGIIMLSLVLGNIPAINQSFFWRPATVTYMFAAILLLLGIITVFSLDNRPILRLFFLALITILMSGLNEIVILIWLTLLISYVLFINPRSWKIFGPVIVIGTLGFLIMAIAPGNHVRSAGLNVVEKKNLVFIVFRSITLSIEVFFRYIKPDLVFLVCLIIPWLLKNKDRVNQAFCRLDSLKKVLGVFVFVSVLFLLPARWAMDGAPPSRAMNVMCVIHLFFTLVLFAQWVWIMPDQARRFYEMTVGRVGDGFFKFGFLVSLIFFSNHFTAWVDLFLKAGQYRQAVNDRYKTLKVGRGEEVVVPPFSAIPITIFFDDIVENKTDWRNSGVSQYFGLKSVRLETN